MGGTKLNDADGVDVQLLEAAGPTGEDLSWLQESGWRLVPRRLEILHCSWIFAWASAGLLAEFILIKQGFLTPPPAGTSGPRQIFLVDAVGLVSCIFWLHGFFMLVHWLHSIKASPGALLGAYTKTVASVLFNVQPLGALCGYGKDSAGADWSNLAGISFFHAGNMISVFDMMVLSANKPGGFNYRNVFSWGNVPVLGMWCYMFGSGLLVPPNSWLYHKGPTFHPDMVHGFQISGATMLLVGSLVFCHWAGWLPKVGRRPARLSNDFWYNVEASY
eukprot:TRINITY_DN3207_c0_g1_i1.p1 TRINITY_DN3207_c0_g1~~TRINITY_DN3207_c0_g1_i1.p1  ORF type:complete len:275 (+),score=73.80 TRINITY_DN3207_c0_g1_i1:64-888(+)